MTGRLKLLLSGLIGTLLAGCGAGTAGIIAGAGDNGGGGTTPAITSFSVPNPKVSPAGLTLEASAAIGTELFYAVGGGPDRAMQLLPGPGISGNSIQLAAGPNDATWDFAADLGTGLTRDVTLRAKRGGALVEGGEVQLFGVGNDAPVVLSVEPLPSDPNEPDESSGIVELLIVTRDSSTDLVDLTVQWRRASGPGHDGGEAA